MPPILACGLTISFIAFLFRRDAREPPGITGALWFPLIWVLLIGSRSTVQWLHIFGLPVSLAAMEEGNPIDAFIYFGLIVAGLYVLNRRQAPFAEVIRTNRWLFAFLLFCFIAIAWSDFPFVAFKRWIKVLGHPIMVLIVFTEAKPEEAFASLMKRAAYILIPVSILFIKYYPDLGRGFDQWSGAAVNVGITTNKNLLGCDCFVLGLFFFWHLLTILRIGKSKRRRNELRLTAGFLIMIGWLLWKANSATSLLSMVIGILVIILLGLPWVDRRLVGTYAVTIAIAAVVAELAFGISNRVVNVSGHGATIFGREELWHELLAMDTSPIFGAGFESFWLGDRLQALWSTHWWNPTEAHNGYLETYLNLGLVGLFMLFGLIIATFRKIGLELFRNSEWGRFRLGFLAAIVIYNWTEATFKGLSLVWFMFYVIALDYPAFGSESGVEAFETSGSEAETGVADFPEMVG